MIKNVNQISEQAFLLDFGNEITKEIKDLLNRLPENIDINIDLFTGAKSFTAFTQKRNYCC